ncbi:MAG: hypothetical protein JST92_25625 [Deltaproteobacteria bacterium]|nr:hypothetical protein [Deltaproteobacteria bacterium]
MGAVHVALDVLAVFVTAYVVLCFLTAAAGIQIVVGGLYVWRADKPSALRGNWLLVEWLAGCVNPLLYMLFLHNVLVRVGSGMEGPLWVGLEWTALVSFWVLRFTYYDLASLHPRVALRAVSASTLLAAMVCLGRLCVDMLGGSKPLAWGDAVLALPTLCALYLVPAAIALRYFVASLDERRLERSEFVLGVAPRFALPGVVAMIGLSSAALWQPSEAVTRARVLAVADDIVRAGQASGVDPALIAAIAFVGQRQHQRPLREQVEELGARLVEAEQTFGVDVESSVGLAQIKPDTLRQAQRYIYGAYVPKRAARRMWNNPEWPSVRVRQMPPGEVNKDVFDVLLDDRQNVHAAGLVLEMYAQQWRAVAPQFAIDRRPDILATLYQIGAEHSHPKADPEANQFGRDVVAAMQEPWLQKAFALECRP